MQREHIAPPLNAPEQACHVPVWRVCADGWQRSTVDVLVEETPVAMVYNGISHAVMLATPTELDDLALGFSLSEGILDDPSQLYGLDIEHSADGISIMMEIASRQFHSLKDRRRALAGRTGCGLCGVDSLDGVARCQTPVSRGAALSASRIFAAVKALERHQPLRQTTGAAHQQTFEVACLVAELNRTEHGSGSSRRIAEQAAAAAMLAHLKTTRK